MHTDGRITNCSLVDDDCVELFNAINGAMTTLRERKETDRKFASNFFCFGRETHGSPGPHCRRRGAYVTAGPLPPLNSPFLGPHLIANTAIGVPATITQV